MPLVRCEHCGEKSDPLANSGHCGHCGRKLPEDWYPSIQLRAPRRGQSRAVREVGKRGAGILFAIAVLQVLCGGIALTAGRRMVPIEPEVLLAIIVVTAAVFAGLAWWALHMPLPALIVGLVLYVGLFVIDLLAMVENRVDPNLGILIRLGFIVMLVRALAAVKAAHDEEDERDEPDYPSFT
jgi:hypothetical protein